MGMRSRKTSINKRKKKVAGAGAGRGYEVGGAEGGEGGAG